MGSEAMEQNETTEAETPLRIVLGPAFRALYIQPPEAQGPWGGGKYPASVGQRINDRLDGRIKAGGEVTGWPKRRATRINNMNSLSTTRITLSTGGKVSHPVSAAPDSRPGLPSPHSLPP